MSTPFDTFGISTAPYLTAATFDEMPAANFPIVRSQPERLAVLAKLYGMQPADIAQARVLELGCASGRNLIPLAERYPEARFVGVDFSTRQIDAAREMATGLGQQNV